MNGNETIEKELTTSKNVEPLLRGHERRRQSSSNSIDFNATYPMGWRHIVTFLAFIGFLLMYALRVNLSVALVAMVNHTALLGDQNALVTNVTTYKSASICTPSGSIQSEMITNGSRHLKTADGPFVWSSETQGIILGAFFYGYILTQFIGGVLAGKYGSKWVFGLGNLFNALFGLLNPVAAGFGVGPFMAVRVLQGFCTGVTFPSMQAFFSRWAPPRERSTLAAIGYAGSFIGTPITFATSGLLIDSGFLGGWPSLFYVYGILCCIWFVVWALVSSSGPQDNKFISRREQAYILRSLCKANRGSAKPGLKNVPWKKVVKSTAVWATVFAHFSYHWSLYVLLTTLPTYFKRVQGLDIKKNGVLSALPYVLQFLLHVTSGGIADFLRNKFQLRTVTVRKLFDCLGHLLPAIFIIGVGFVGCNSMAAVALLTLAIGCTGLCGAGWFVNFLDIAPQYAGILFGISNTIATIPGIIGPFLTGYITKDNTIGSWRAIFFIIGTLYACSSVFFAIFGKGDVQPWAMAKNGQGSMEIPPRERRNSLLT